MITDDPSPDTVDRLRAIVGDVLEIGTDAVARDASFEDLAIDSLEKVEVVARVGEELGVVLDLDTELTTIDQLAAAAARAESARETR